MKFANDMKEGLEESMELAEAVREEAFQVEIPPPVHYPPSPPGDIDVFSVLEEPEESEELLVEKVFSPEETPEPAAAPPPPGPFLPRSYSFACGGWLQFWLWGVAKAIQDYDLLHPEAKVAGCSAGMVVVVVVVVDIGMR